MIYGDDHIHYAIEKVAGLPRAVRQGGGGRIGELLREKNLVGKMRRGKVVPGQGMQGRRGSPWGEDTFLNDKLQGPRTYDKGYGEYTSGIWRESPSGYRYRSGLSQGHTPGGYLKHEISELLGLRNLEGIGRIYARGSRDGYRWGDSLVDAIGTTRVQRLARAKEILREGVRRNKGKRNDPRPISALGSKRKKK